MILGFSLPKKCVTILTTPIEKSFFFREGFFPITHKSDFFL